MKDPTVIHPLAQRGVPSGKITFIHNDGTEHYYYSVVNRLTGCRMSAFDGNPPEVDTPLREVRVMFRNIRAKAKRVVSVVGDF